jgi:hypothetical protein
MTTAKAPNMSSNNSQPQPPRTSPKIKSTRANSQQWKDNLRRECLERAKSARRQRMMRQRSGDTCNSSSCHAGQNNVGYNLDFGSTQGMKRVRGECGLEADRCYDEATGQQITFMSNYPSHPEEVDSMQIEAKALVEQELQRSMMGLRHCHQILPLDDLENASKRKLRGGDGFIVDSTMDCCLDQQLDAEDECKMSEEEYLELINAVTEELEREGMDVYFPSQLCYFRYVQLCLYFLQSIR